jgi:hypothetical protein
VDAGVLTCEQQTTDYVLDQHVSEGCTVSDKEDGDEEVLVLLHLEVMSAIQTIRNYVSAASANSCDTVCKL